MKKVLFVIILIIVSMISVSCGKKETAPSTSASSGNALPQPSVDCGGSDCL